MSLPKFETQGSLFEGLGSLAANLFSDQDRYKLFATKIWPLLAKSREELAGCYVQDNGRPSVEPVVLLGVLIFQFLERVPDRQAAELVKYHLGWKLALNLDLNFKGIHHTSLSYFRERLLEKGKADLAMRIISKGLQEAGLLKKRSKQRLDSTHIIGAVARLSALECVRETLAMALEELQPRLKSEPEFWAVLWERYVESKLDYKSGEETLRAKQRQAGEDCFRLLQWLDPLPVELRAGKQVALLREVFTQQYAMEGASKAEPVKVHATAVVQNPHDPEAEWSAKGRGKHKKEWVGYKVQIAETVPQKEGQIGFITSVVTQRASQSDDPGLELTLKKQEQLGLKRPSEMYADGAYICAEAITEAKEEGWDLMGPAQPSPGSTKQPALYRIEAFDVNIEERRALCPQGKTSTECSKLTEGETGKVTYRFEFGRHCRDCEVKHLCVPRGQPHRMIRVGALHETLQQRRREQKTEQFKLRMHQRNGIEGTISELVRGHGLRRARYKGFAKLDLQNQLIAAACNIKRWLGKLSHGDCQIAPEAHLGPRGLLACSIASFKLFFDRLLHELTFSDSFSLGLR